MTKEVCIFIDAQYVYEIIKEFKKLYGIKYAIEYNQFAITLAKELNLWLTKTYYYTAPPYQSQPPTPKERERLRGYNTVMKHYRHIQNFYIREGRCQKINEDYQEKGVDTLFTMDLMETAHENKVKNVILVACDTDYVPAIKRLKEKYQINVYLFNYNDKIRNSKFSLSNYLESSCDKCILLTKEHFEKSKLKK